MTATALPGDPEITTELVSEHGLNEHEYGLARQLLGRDPTFTELGIFSALWSEHCSYKHSRNILKTLPTSGSHVIQGPGENAGILRLGHGWAVAFKIESHNHPSAVEPYQGAATGVGGILRDVFTMGARPVALLNSLRFGPLDHARNRYLLAGAVKGIGDYGNCVGVPTIGGEVSFDPGYTGNPLVNAMAIGIMREENVTRAVASGPGNVLIAVGARTGRDGIHGASFASEELTEESEARRPQVQVGDPFTEKLLIEASLEMISAGVIVAIQDMGAAGLTSSSAEMAARGGVGVEIDTSCVPVRESAMTPYEILLSESQERMLVVAEPGQVDAIKKIAEKWDLESAVIGKVTDDGYYRVRHGQDVVVEIPGERLVEEAPRYTPKGEESEEARARRAVVVNHAGVDVEDALYRLVSHPQLASKRWVHEQYDSSVRGTTVVHPGGDAGVVMVPGTTLGIAASTDCNSRYVLLDPRAGTAGAVVEAARNVACTGARPIGVTNCLNFGSPEKPAVFYQFSEACRGMAEACEVLGTPVTGGNVSFYNENPGGAIPPTPVIGMIGVLEDVENRVPSHFREPGDDIILLGRTTGHLGGSSLWAYVLDTVAGSPPPVELASDKALVDLLVELASGQLICSAHDLSDGGVALALTECCIRGPYSRGTLGASVNLTRVQHDLDSVAMMFAEDHGRALLSTNPANTDRVLRQAGESGVPASVIGKVGKSGEAISVELADGLLSFDTNRLRTAYEGTLPAIMSMVASSND